ncbi:MAG: aminomethyl-transferring glycine dehydrogenase subunit GcvPA [Negativibacillus sp.]|nr:aminomethyl-transferring glycine dehydrogenase subunit GcvPA [Negativibacillus sp.]
MGSYVPSTLQERQEMLESIGLSSIDQLFSHIPDALKLKGELNLPSGMSELEVSSAMKKIAAKNVVFGSIFRGAGAYDHYIPSIVKSVTGKEEFLTAYTPYQAEISQGVLQSIFEYQTMICELTGMDVSNASVYDGATAAAEAVNMCCERSRKVVFCSAAAHPDTIAVVKTYCWAAGHELVLLPVKDGKTDLDAMASQLDKKTSACLYLQSPNFFGQLEEMEKAAEMIHSVGAKLIAGCNPIALGLLKTPAEQGADIAVGEGQPLGMPLSFGGPYLGFMAATQAMMRKLPGRIVGETVDVDGKRAFVLTLQAREQHIRREKASSNICSNQALCALTASVYLATVGPDGLKQAASLCYQKAHYLAQQLCSIPGVSLRYSGTFFHEFVTDQKDSDKLLSALEQQGILGGYPLADGGILWCATEKNTKEEMDRVVEIIRKELM